MNKLIKKIPDKNDNQWFSFIRKNFFTAVVGDVLDKLGYQHQFLPQAIKPVRDNMVLVGRAMPVLESDYFGDVGQTEISIKPFGLMFQALDDLKPDEIYITTGASFNYAQWGGLMSTRAICCRAAGAVLNGYHRDTREILQLNFPVFSCGSYAQDQGVRGKVIDWRVPIKINQTAINNGDVIFADHEGVLIVPQAVEKEVFQLAWEKINTENQVRIAIQKGMSTVAAFNKFGVM